MKVWVAYSGGLDSHVLLSLCQASRSELHFELAAIHINHGLSPHAKSWATHCARVCADYQIEYHERNLALDKRIGDSLEESARYARYAVFAEYLQAGDMLLTAHQQDDQAETVLVQLLRGAGPKGLAAMPELKSFAKGWHARPLLNFTRAALQQYAKEQQLHWLDDESNKNTKFTRNFIRHDVLPLLKQRWPTVAKTLARSATHCAESQGLLEEISVDLCNKVRGFNDKALSVTRLLMLRADEQRLVLRTWIQKQGYPVPNSQKLESIQRDVLLAARDRQPYIRWQGVELRRHRDDLFLLAQLSPHAHTKTWAWDLVQPLILPQLGVLHAIPVIGQGLCADIQAVSVRFRQGGEQVHLHERGHRTLKNLFQEWGVLPWMRNRVPLLFVEDTLVMVLGYFIDAAYAAKPEEEGWKIGYGRMD